MDVKDAALFIKVATSLSLKTAAEQAGTSRSWVSKRIAVLEREVGSILLTRTPRSVALTQAGEIFLKYCTQICEIVDEARSDLLPSDSAAANSVRVEFDSWLGLRFVLGVLDAHSARCPQTQIAAHVGVPLSTDLAADFDLAIRVAQRPPIPSAGMRKLWTSARLLIASPSYLRRNGSPRSADDLVHHSLLGTRVESARPNMWNFDAIREPLAMPVKCAYTFNDPVGLIDAAIAGLGISYVPIHVVDAPLRSGHLVTVLPETLRGESGVFALFKHKRLPSQLESFLETLREARGELDGAVEDVGIPRRPLSRQPVRRPTPRRATTAPYRE